MKNTITIRIAMLSLALAVGTPFFAGAKDANPPAKIKLDETAINRDAKTGNSYSAVIKKASPSVVTIYSTKTRTISRYPAPYFGDPFLDRFFGGDPRRQVPQHFQERSLGSGVIVTEDGYILTNNHVVEGADKDGVKVALSDGKQKFTARVVGSDPQTDIALLKVDAKNLAAITLANSDKLEVGDVVLAIGNPFNVGQSVSFGIVSALGRDGFNIADYEDFIQTDAAINPGNSGGALVDAEGRLIGINQSIVSQTGGNLGVGFAVPINLARTVMDRLLSDGKVRRGYLGILIQPLTPEVAKMFKVTAEGGALIGGVTPGSPAENAGLKEGDVIIEINGKKTSDSGHARLMISQNLPGTQILLTIIRDGKEKKMSARLAAMPSDTAMDVANENKAGPQETDALAGVEFGELDAATRSRFRIPARVQGVMVSSVSTDSSAYEAGLRAGNVIQEINRQAVTGTDEALALCKKAQGEHLLLRVWFREGSFSGSHYLMVGLQNK